ncbi:MAG TPA: chaperonin GroEL [Herpetosiphonaceae bacterium]|nr:chaperonin GroEL [Herpetosiphonaceae bacterium]
MAPSQVIPGIVFQPRSHQGIQRGINQIVDAVRPTLGPRPRLVAVENVLRDKTPELLDNAALIARRIFQLPQRDADMGAMLVRHMLWRLHEEVGDGTATAAVIFQAVYNQGVRYIAAGGNAMQLSHSLEHGMQAILDELSGRTMQLEGQEQLTQLAESICFDMPLARMLGEIFDIVGADGQVEIRTSHRPEIERQYIEGMYWKGGVLSPHMLSDQIRLRTDLTNAAILISDLEITEPRHLMPVLDIATDAQIRALLIVANKLSDSSIGFLIAASRNPEQFQVIAAKTPGLGTVEQAAAMEDLSILTGGRPLLQAAGDTLRGLKATDLGQARRAWVDRFQFGIVGGKGDARTLRAHIGALRAAFSVSQDKATRTALQQRIGKLIGGSAILTVGGHTKSEISAREELARRTSDALRAAIRDGVLPGGGIALLACRPRLRELLAASTDPDEQAAYRILIHALEQPIRTIAGNSGYEPGAVLAEVDQAQEAFGFDVRCGRIADMAESGIFDVAAAQRAAIRGAISGAATALTVDILVHKRKPEETPGRP